jgi:hypothetical protein
LISQLVRAIEYSKTHLYLISRKVLFDLAVEGETFIGGLDSLSKAINAFFYICFVAGLEYPEVRYGTIDNGISVFFLEYFLVIHVVDATFS